MRHAAAMCALVITMVTVAFADPAAAVDRLVDETLVPCAPGGVPIHDTIGAAVAAAAAGETIGVCAGTYTEAVTVLTDDLVLQALGPVKLVSPGTPDSGFVVFSSGVTIQGFDIAGFTSFAQCGIAVIDAAGTDIRNNRVHDNDFGICEFLGTGTRIRNNLAEGNLTDGILLVAADSTQVTGNTTRNNVGFGIEASGCDFSPVVVPTTLSHNSVTGNDAGGIRAEECGLVVQNNTVRNGAPAGSGVHGIHVLHTSNPVVTRNLVQTSDVGALIELVSGCTVSFNSVSFHAVGIDVVESEGCTFTRNNVTRSEVVGCRWDELGTHTFTNNACASEIPPGAWD